MISREKWKILTHSQKCGQFGQNNCCHLLWKVAQSAINSTIWSQSLGYSTAPRWTGAEAYSFLLASSSPSYELRKTRDEVVLRWREETRMRTRTRSPLRTTTTYLERQNLFMPHPRQGRNHLMVRCLATEASNKLAFQRRIIVPKRGWKQQGSNVVGAFEKEFETENEMLFRSPFRASFSFSQ